MCNIISWQIKILVILVVFARSALITAITNSVTKYSEYRLKVRSVDFCVCGISTMRLNLNRLRWHKEYKCRIVVVDFLEYKFFPGIQFFFPLRKTSFVNRHVIKKSYVHFIIKNIFDRK